jgi:hypothetical protein
MPALQTVSMVRPLHLPCPRGLGLFQESKFFVHLIAIYDVAHTEETTSTNNLLELRLINVQASHAKFNFRKEEGCQFVTQILKRYDFPDMQCLRKVVIDLPFTIVSSDLSSPNLYVQETFNTIAEAIKAFASPKALQAYLKLDSKTESIEPRIKSDSDRPQKGCIRFWNILEAMETEFREGYNAAKEEELLSQ